jgi:hypothetical protein
MQLQTLLLTLAGLYFLYIARRLMRTGRVEFSFAKQRRIRLSRYQHPIRYKTLTAATVLHGFISLMIATMYSLEWL